jgi:hypothetical protein
MALLIRQYCAPKEAADRRLGTENVGTPMESATDLYFSSGYWIKGITNGCKTQNLVEREAAATAAMEVLKRHRPDLSMHIYTRWD